MEIVDDLKDIVQIGIKIRQLKAEKIALEYRSGLVCKICAFHRLLASAPAFFIRGRRQSIPYKLVDKYVTKHLESDQERKRGPKRRLSGPTEGGFTKPLVSRLCCKSDILRPNLIVRLREMFEIIRGAPYAQQGKSSKAAGLCPGMNTRLHKPI